MPRREAYVMEDRSPRGAGERVLRGMLAPAVLLTVIGVTVAVAFHLAESYVVRDPRFALQLPPVAGEPATLAVAGLARVPEERVREVFRADGGKSVYELPIEDRRMRLKNIDWVRDAAVARRWPNRVEVYVTERRPVAFARLPKDRQGRSRIAFIDEEGMLLPITERDRGRYDLPVLSGIREDQKMEDRALRVRQMLRFYAEAKGAPQLVISEVNLSDLRNLKCQVKLAGRGYLLLMGQEDFAYNLRRFEQHMAEIERKMPHAAVLDMRSKDAITASRDEERNGE
jgi:cell division septal protein FtsQ